MSMPNGQWKFESESWAAFAAPLLAWYRANKRDLPWRQDRDAYHIWVSEIMLQQTRVEAVIPYYQRFIKRCPDIASLAACKEEELLKLWEGLGYYSRVKNMKKAAQIICKDYQGQFPKELEKILELPGIGAYTAGAIASIAFEQAAAAVDGNVLRVITRLTQDSSDIMDAKFRKEVTAMLERVYPKQGRGDFTQSLMELGAVVCVPNGAPKCKECPISFLCGAYQNQAQMQYPVKKKKAARKIQKKTVVVLWHEDKVALHKRGEKGLLSGMWELPNMDGYKTFEELKQWLANQGIMVRDAKKPENTKNEVKHIFTHIEWHMQYWIVSCEAVAGENNFTWVTQEQIKTQIALPTAFRKVYGKAQKGKFNSIGRMHL